MNTADRQPETEGGKSGPSTSELDFEAVAPRWVEHIGMGAGAATGFVLPASMMGFLPLLVVGLVATELAARRIRRNRQTMSTISDGWFRRWETEAREGTDDHPAKTSTRRRFFGFDSAVREARLRHTAWINVPFMLGVAIGGSGIVFEALPGTEWLPVALSSGAGAAIGTAAARSWRIHAFYKRVRCHALDTYGHQVS